MVTAILVRIPAERESRELFFSVFQLFYTINISPGLRRGNRLAGGSLLTIAAILVRIQAEREGGDYILVCFNIFIPCIFLPSCAWGTGLPAALYSRLRRFWLVYKRNRTVGIWFWYV